MTPATRPDHDSPSLHAWLVRYQGWVWLVILLLATATRFYALDRAGLWADELWGVDACSLGSWWAMIDQMILKDSHPPGYQTLLYVWMQLFGETDAMIRLPSVLAGIAAVHALYRFGLRFLSVPMALVAATFLAVSYQGIYYSQEARAYIFLVLFAIWHWHLLLLLFVERERQTRYWVAFWVVGLLLSYFHYVGVVIVAAEALALWLLPAHRPGWRLWLKAFKPIVIGYLPWSLVMLQHLLHPDQSWETQAPGLAVLADTARFLWGPATSQLVLAAPACIAYLGWCVVRFRTGNLPVQDQRILQVVLLASLPWLLFFVKSHVSESAYTVRHFIYMLPAVLLINARVLLAVLAWFRPGFSFPWLGAVLVGLAWLVMQGNLAGDIRINEKLYTGLTRQEYREAARLIASDKPFMTTEKKNVFVTNVFFNHYLRRERVRYKPAPFMHASAPEKLPEYATYIRDQGMQHFYYLEVFENLNTRAASPLLRALQQQYHTVCETHFFWVRVVKFNTRLPANPGATPRSCPRQVDPAATGP